ncbi:hypothetical protein [Nocardioides yefusunii]|uniref:DUF1223 domain-containing protein n=1 Tax=Nocardioides yefusunii TaxID=2500546 RepID=A0ABW1QST0_9ACTN|nr:hypothetical protein [Nocardioides yefusunii]
MRTRPHRPVLAAALAAVALTLGVVPAAHAVVGQSRASITTITITSTGCSGCRVVASWTPRLEGQPSFYSGDVKGGRAVLRVPTGRTKGLAFTVVHPRPQGKVYGLPLVAVKYQGVATGTKVTPARAAKARRAKVCWAGTSARTVSLRMRTARDPKLASVGGYRHWFSATPAATGSWRAAPRGSVSVRSDYGVCL